MHIKNAFACRDVILDECNGGKNRHYQHHKRMRSKKKDVNMKRVPTREKTMPRESSPEQRETS
jgi:hypothetical protein